MSGHKIERISEDIKRELTAILREVKDPRVQGGLISVVRVEVTNDLSYCKVFISSIEGTERAKSAVEGLKSATGFIKRALGKNLEVRHIPVMLFYATDSIEYSANISKMLDNLKGGSDDSEPSGGPR